MPNANTMMIARISQPNMAIPWSMSSRSSRMSASKAGQAARAAQTKEHVGGGGGGRDERPQSQGADGRRRGFHGPGLAAGRCRRPPVALGTLSQADHLSSYAPES